MTTWSVWNSPLGSSLSKVSSPPPRSQRRGGGPNKKEGHRLPNHRPNCHR